MKSATGISIGLPVYNGENYLVAAIESILAQSHADFELIISDNASEDATPAICRSYAARDGRIRYFRNETNIGAAPNFNRAFARASGSYFKWMAHDDVLAPDFLAASLEALEREPDAVLSYSAVDIIDDRGGVLFHDDSRLPGTERPRPSERFAEAIINQHMCFPVFALIRAEVLQGSSLLANYDGSDRALVAELALRGRFTYVDKPLFSNRDHPRRYIRAVRPQRDTALGWWTTASDRRLTLHLWNLYGDYFRMVRREVRDPLERLHCYRHLVRWLAVDWNVVRLLVDLIGLIDPRVFALARRAKHGLFGPPDEGHPAAQEAARHPDPSHPGRHDRTHRAAHEDADHRLLVAADAADEGRWQPARRRGRSG